MEAESKVAAGAMQTLGAVPPTAPPPVVAAPVESSTNCIGALFRLGSGGAIKGMVGKTCSNIRELVKQAQLEVPGEMKKEDLPPPPPATQLQEVVEAPQVPNEMEAGEPVCHPKLYPPLSLAPETVPLPEDESEGEQQAPAVEMPTSTGPFANTVLQPQRSRELFNLSTLLARQAFYTVPEAKSLPTFTNVRQGLTEPYFHFIDRLSEALQAREDLDDENKKLMLKLFAFGNANSKTKSLLATSP